MRVLGVWGTAYPVVCPDYLLSLTIKDGLGHLGIWGCRVLGLRVECFEISDSMCRICWSQHLQV